MRTVSRSPAAIANLKAVDACGALLDEYLTQITFEVTDMPKYLTTCGLGGTKLIVKKLWGWCDGAWSKEVPIRNACGDEVIITECQPDQIIYMPGHYRVEIANCPGARFPEDFDHELYGVAFDFAKCWLQQRSNA